MWIPIFAYRELYQFDEIVFSLQKEEVSAELLTFHEVVNHMQEDEEEVIDDHRVITEVIAWELRLQEY